MEDATSIYVIFHCSRKVHTLLEINILLNELFCFIGYIN